MPHPVPIEDDEDQPRDQRWLGPGDRLAFDINLMDSAAPGRRIGDNASAVTGEAAALAARAARLANLNRSRGRNTSGRG